MKIRRSFICFSFILLLLIGSIPGDLWAQLKTHEIGRLWDSQFPTGSMPEYSPLQDQMTYPGGDFFYQKPKNLERQGLWIGVTNWTDYQQIFHSYYIAECGPLNYEGLNYATAISIKKRVRNRLPLVYVNDQKESRLLDSRNGATLDTTLAADEKITTEWTTQPGVTVTKNSYAFANRQHDSYHIIEYLFQNTGNIDKDKTTIELRDQNLQNVYFSFMHVFIPSGDVGHLVMGEEVDEWVHYYGHEPGDTLRGLWYCYDGDNQKKAFDDRGDPSETTGEFLAPQYLGVGILHADAAYDDLTDDLTQPQTVHWWPDHRWYSHDQGYDEQTLYAEISSGIKSQGTDVTGYRNAWQPEVQHPMVFFSFGPYQLPFGKSLRIVLYRSAGMISRQTALAAGKQWKQGQLSFAGQTGDAAKNALLATGRDSLFRSAGLAQWTWRHGLAAVPDGPPSMDLTITSGPGKIELQWSDVAAEPDPDTKELDFAGYRVFRAVEHYTNEYQLLWECGGNSGNPVAISYTDFDVQRGVSYYYYVVAFDRAGHTSSHFYNRNFQYGASPFLGAQAQMDSIYVVPNPFHVQGLAFGGTVDEDYREVPRPEDRLYFMGLPFRAKIRIFTVHGDLVETLEHPDPREPLSIEGSADRVWYQISMSWQNIKSGVYFYSVEGWNHAGSYLGATTGKFVVIR
ncbi:hypothetical protein L0128_19090 [candidate division KSB1 bacterium]|nr:hypothetical protein [candidate division KSB1 bacterium]